MNGSNIGFVGAGRLGTALALELAAKGYAVAAVSSRSLGSVQRLAAQLGPRTRACAFAQEVADACALVFITTPDDAIGAVAGQVRWRQGQQVAHCSGALSIDILAPVVKVGGEVASFHPLQSFASQRRDPFAGITIGLEGKGRLLEQLKTIAADLGAHSIVVPSEEKAAYHAAAVFASNYVVTLTKTGTDILKGLNVAEADAEAALLGLLRGVVRNMEENGVQKALTGPITRGDVGTVRRHVATLAKSPALADAYRSLGRLTVPIAQANGGLSHKVAEELLGLLAGNSKEVDQRR